MKTKAPQCDIQRQNEDSRVPIARDGGAKRQIGGDYNRTHKKVTERHKAQRQRHHSKHVEQQHYGDRRQMQHPQALRHLVWACYLLQENVEAYGENEVRAESSIQFDDGRPDQVIGERIRKYKEKPDKEGKRSKRK
ncbi:MAG: hypothetical protein P8181_17235 [bacterium]